MSGFVGLFQVDAPVDAALLERLTRALTACGPDGQATRIQSRAGLGHARLDVTADILPVEQPRTIDGTHWIVADARIDDRVRLRSELRAAGHLCPDDTPDVDLILHAYAAWGDRCLDHLIGDFAFVIWDGRALFGARDQFGVIPFFYAEVPGGLVVSNALGVVRRHPAVSDRWNEAALGDFLVFCMNLRPGATMFADVQRLPPGHRLHWRDGQLRISQYWAPEEPVEEPRFDRPARYIERFRHALEAAVSDRLRTDRAGAHLSGGMDSASVVATAAKVLRARGRPFDLRTYTVVYRSLVQEEEGRFAAAVASALALPSETLVGEDVPRLESTGDWDPPEPCAFSGRLAEHEITRRVASFARVLLTGFGGDPLFSFVPSRWATAVPDTAFWNGLRQVGHASLWGRWSRLGLRSARRRTARALRARAVPVWINQDFARRLRLVNRAREVAAERSQTLGLRVMRAPYWSTIFEQTHAGFHGVPIQITFPLFDLRVVREVAATPAFPWRSSKRLLREAMRDRIPELVRLRPKTPLYVNDPRNPQRNPGQMIASVPGVRRLRRHLLQATDLSAFVNVRAALELVDSPISATPGLALDSCICLAHWISYAAGVTVPPLEIS